MPEKPENINEQEERVNEEDSQFQREELDESDIFAGGSSINDPYDDDFEEEEDKAASDEQSKEKKDEAEVEDKGLEKEESEKKEPKKEEPEEDKPEKEEKEPEKEETKESGKAPEEKNGKEPEKDSEQAGKASEEEKKEQEPKKEESEKAEKEPEPVKSGSRKEPENGPKEKAQGSPQMVQVNGETFYSRDFTKKLITQALKMQAEGMLRYGNNFMQSEPGMQPGPRGGFGLQPSARQMAAGGYGFGQTPMRMGGYGRTDMGNYPGMGAYPQQMSQYGQQAGNTKEGKTFLGALAYIFSEVPILGVLLQLLDMIWKGCKNIVGKTVEVVKDAISGPKNDPRLLQMMKETEDMRGSCERRLTADQNFISQSGTYMDAAMGTNYMGAQQIPEYGPTAMRLADPSVSPEFSGFLNAEGGEKTTENLLETGKDLREKTDAKKEKESVDKEKDEKQQEKRASEERKRSRDDSDMIRHNRPTLERENTESRKGRSAGRSL